MVVIMNDTFINSRVIKNDSKKKKCKNSLQTSGDSFDKF